VCPELLMYVANRLQFTKTAESIYGTLLAFGYELMVDVQRGARTSRGRRPSSARSRTDA
jgi:hypothetical protein